ncbi:uncharacterized protein H6S33_005548 [Morchella sextelata]|uniref:uncharacterized protein n=1 Tax=Morchella sextelata TaxID=1174677 RepID=UPI001D04F8AB|nr:uncharacterized protein H6S33_005548 [Morchella sextelata]KAH0613662.1 hypothetical protein H6S33_005548 [Morchella sextelata]
MPTGLGGPGPYSSVRRLEQVVATSESSSWRLVVSLRSTTYWHRRIMEDRGFSTLRSTTSKSVTWYPLGTHPSDHSWFVKVRFFGTHFAWYHLIRHLNLVVILSRQLVLQD